MPRRVAICLVASLCVTTAVAFYAAVRQTAEVVEEFTTSSTPRGGSVADPSRTFVFSKDWSVAGLMRGPSGDTPTVWFEGTGGSVHVMDDVHAGGRFTERPNPDLLGPRTGF